MARKAIAVGLKDVVAGHTSICVIDDRRSRLFYRGYNVRDLVANASFAETAYLLLYENLPNEKQLKDFSTELSGQRELPGQVTQVIRDIPKSAHPMAVLRTAVSFLALLDPASNDLSNESNLRKAISLLARIPTIIAYFHRTRSSQPLVSPKTDAAVSSAANLLYMLRGQDPKPIEAEMLDKYLILSAEHDYNASTFVARTTASTLSDIYSAVTAAVGALKGDLHGSAIIRSMETQLAIGDPSNVEAYVDKVLAEKKKLMGFGHRVYKGADPRADELRKMAKRLAGENADEAKRFAVAEKLEKTVWDRKKLYCNVDFYASSVLYSVGIPMDLLGTMFALSRTAGWSAHILEQYASNRLIRPISQYIGRRPRAYVPLKKRQ